MISRSKKTIGILALCVSLLSGACSSGILKSLSEMARLRQKLIDKYHEPDISVSLQNSRYLNIVFINSPLNQQDASERAKRARETARFVVANFPAIDKIQYLWIMFMTSETRWIFYHYSRRLDAFVFDKNGEELNSRSD